MIKNKYAGQGYENRMGQPLAYPPEQLKKFFFSMLRIRLIEFEIERRYKEDEMKTPIHLVIGQEASCVGAAEALKVTDLAYCGHRTHGLYLAKGGDYKAMMSELYCRANGCAGSRGGSMHLIDKKVGMAGTSAIVAGAIPISVGAALAMKIRKEKNVSYILFGDAATEEGACSESLNFAALKKLPVIFFCENNFFSVCSPLEYRQPEGVDIGRRSAGFGMPSVKIDGNNVLDVYDATMAAAERARRGEGPTFIEAMTYRWRGHGGAGDDSASGYRDPAEVVEWQKADPIELFYAFLTETKVLTAADRAQYEKDINAEIKEAFDHAIKSPNPTEQDLATHVYAD
jgi:TPP-dependent pyruvate/acetoin dehydrogenase alpha subunit